MKQESEANGVACRERHRRVDPLPIEARKKEVERLQGIIQKLRREAVTSRNKAEQEIKASIVLLYIGCKGDSEAQSIMQPTTCAYAKVARKDTCSEPFRNFALPSFPLQLGFMQQRDTEIEALRRSCQLQREHIEKQKKEILALELTLRDYRITDMDQFEESVFACTSTASCIIPCLPYNIVNVQYVHETEAVLLTMCV
eukprot:306569-Pelagomonas_calceolata.AAC.10